MVKSFAWPLLKEMFGEASPANSAKEKYLGSAVFKNVIDEGISGPKLFPAKL